MKLFEKLAAAEKQFFESEFLSPVIKGQTVRVRIAGIVMTFNISPKKYEGWGIFKTVDQKNAKFVREASRTEKQQYFDLMDKFSVIVCKQGEKPLGLLANSSDNRIQINGVFPILLAEELRLFQSINVRHDGFNFWYEGVNSQRTSKVANALRELFSQGKKIEDIQISGLVPEELLAYGFAYNYDLESKKNREEERIKSAITRAGATFKSYVERGSAYTIEYNVDGHNYTSTVNKTTLEVTSSGICLSGQDKLFDLQSLVTVMREGQNRGRINRYG